MFNVNHHPVFLWIGGLLLTAGAIFYKLSNIEYFAYSLSISLIFLTRYMVNIHFLENLNKKYPFLYFFLWNLDIYIFAIWLPQTIIGYYLK